MDRDLFNCGEDNERIRLHLLRKDLCGEILIDDGCSAFQMMSFRLEYRNASATTGDDHMVRLDQRPDRPNLHDRNRLRQEVMVMNCLPTWVVMNAGVMEFSQ